MLFRTLLLLSALVSIPNRARADTRKTTIGFEQGVTFPIGLSQAFRAPPGLTEGALVSHRIGDGRWSWTGEAGIGTPFKAFKPWPYAVAGTTQGLAGTFALAEGISWRWVPGHDDTPSVHSLGAEVTPVFNTIFGAALFPLGFACPIKESSECIATMGVKLDVDLTLKRPAP